MPKEGLAPKNSETYLTRMENKTDLKPDLKPQTDGGSLTVYSARVHKTTPTSLRLRAAESRSTARSPTPNSPDLTLTLSTVHGQACLQPTAMRGTTTTTHDYSGDTLRST